MNILIPIAMWFVENCHEINRLWQNFKDKYFEEVSYEV